MHRTLGTVIAEKYRLDSVVGNGDSSTVYAATNLMTGKQVAIKLRPAETTADAEHSLPLLHEAEAASAIDHPNVVNVIDVGQHDGAVFLVMELLHGETLSALMLRGTDDRERFVGLLMPALRGLHAAHRSGVVHGDLNPENIFLCRGPDGEAREAKVLDFGGARPIDARGRDRELTGTAAALGTPLYTAPEQLREPPCVDARSDIYALGVILYRAFSGTYPYGAESIDALTARMHDGRAAPLAQHCPELPRGLVAVVMRAVAVEPVVRFSTVAALGKALEPYAGGVPFSPAAAERESATQLKYLRVPAKLAPQRVYAPPRARRDSEPSTVAPQTMALDVTDLLAVAEASPSWRRITPVPPVLSFAPRKHTSLRGNDGERETPKRSPGPALRLGLLIAGALFTTGLLVSLSQSPRTSGSAASSASGSHTLATERGSPLSTLKPAFSMGAKSVDPLNRRRSSAHPVGDSASMSSCAGEGRCAPTAIPYGKETPRVSRRRARALAAQRAAERSASDNPQPSSASHEATTEPTASRHVEHGESPDEQSGHEGQEPKPLETNPYLHR